MKNVFKILAILFITQLTFSQEIAITKEGKTVKLHPDGTYEVLNTKSAKGKIKGVVTYFFNNNYGDKPDTGSKVFIRKTSDADSTNSIVSKYKIVTDYRTIIKNYKFLNKPTEEYSNKLNDLGCGTDELYKDLCDKVSMHIIKTKITKDVINLIADGNGNFETEVEQGKYEVIIISNHRTKNTLVEGLGQIESLVVEVNPNSTTQANTQFKL